MRYSAGRELPGNNLFPELAAARNRSRQRRKWTRLAMIALSFLGGVILAGLAYMAFWAISFGAQFAVAQAHSQVANSISIAR